MIHQLELELLDECFSTVLAHNRVLSAPVILRGETAVARAQAAKHMPAVRGKAEGRCCCLANKWPIKVKGTPAAGLGKSPDQREQGLGNIKAQF